MIYLSYDIDANDPSYAPGTGTPEAFGLPSVMTLKIIMNIVEKLNVCAMDFVEISPRLDSNDITTWLGLKTLYEVINVLKNKQKQKTLETFLDKERKDIDVLTNDIDASVGNSREQIMVDKEEYETRI